MPEWGLTKEMRATRPYELGEWWLEPGKVITDPVHGDIFVTRLEQAFLDTPPMQRLRRVRQLGATHLVYPGATHTRFAHSLGAVRAVQDLLDMAMGQRNRNHAVADLFDEWERDERRSDTAISAAPGDDWTIAEATAEVEHARTIHLRKLAEATVLARLGALLHDVGHLPYGHSIEDDLDLLIPHDENTSRFCRLWAEMISAIEESALTVGHRRNWSETKIRDRVNALAPLRDGGRLYMSLRPLILSKERDKSGKRIDPVDQLVDYPFVADIVGNTICADLLDYLQRDHRFSGLPMSLGQRFMSSFYVIPGDVGGIYKRRMALLIHRDGRPRQDVVTEIIKHLRYRYELQERVLVHHLKLTADAMLGKMIELWHEAEKSGIEAFAPETLAAELAKIPRDFAVEVSSDTIGEIGRHADTSRLQVVGDVKGVESSNSEGDRQGVDHTEEKAERLARWRLEQMLLERGDDGVLEHLRSGLNQDGEAAAASRELASRLLDRSLYQHAANATAAFAAKDLHQAFGSAAHRRELENKAARHADLDADWHVILWVPGPDMRLKLAEVLVDHGEGIAKFVDYSAKGSDIYEDHKRLWTISVFVHPTVSEEQTRMVLAKLAQLMRVSWDRYQDQLGADPDISPQRLAAIEVCQAGPLTEKVRDLIAMAGEEQAARGGDDPTHSELVQRYNEFLDAM